MEHIRRRHAFSAIILSTTFFWPVCALQAQQSSALKLADTDRAMITRSVLRSIFKPGSAYEGKYLIFANGIRREWLPKIAGYELALVTQRQLESSEDSTHYWVVSLEPLRRSVRVAVHLYDLSDGGIPEVMLYYSYHRVNGKWRGRYLWGLGN